MRSSVGVVAKRCDDDRQLVLSGAKIDARCKVRPRGGSRLGVAYVRCFTVDFTHCVTLTIDQTRRVCEPSRVAIGAMTTRRAKFRAALATSVALATSIACLD